jgi:hypothetical protein
MPCSGSFDAQSYASKARAFPGAHARLALTETRIACAIFFFRVRAPRFREHCAKLFLGGSKIVEDSTMREDAICAALYRTRAKKLRAEASQISKPGERKKILGLADEYDWRAASVEAAIVLSQAGVTKSDPRKFA